ncbi:MAG: Txe/YoeB family addiction module toxin [Bacteroidota bacterium]
MKSVRFESKAYQDFINWAGLDKNIFRKINQLIRDIDRDPYSGLGKPESLKYELQGWWSRRINQEHRLIYKVEQDTIIIVGCKGHYLS